MQKLALRNYAKQVLFRMSPVCLDNAMSHGRASEGKRLSSRFTFFNKRVFPAIWFGFLGLFFFVGLLAAFASRPEGVAFVVGPVIMGVGGYFVMKHLVLDLIDEVYDEGQTLLLKNGGKEERIDLSEIRNVSYSTTTNPPRITLSLRRDTIFGSEVSFMPPMSLIPFKKNAVIQELIDRVDSARGS